MSRPRLVQSFPTFRLSDLMENSYASPALTSVLVLGLVLAFTLLVPRRSLRGTLGSPGKAPVGLTNPKGRSDLNKDRQFGDWTPVDFRYPPVDACQERLVDIKPIPYRPFKWGAYHVNMGISNMPWNDWIELDRDHEKYHRIKLHRMQLRGDKAVRVLEDSNPLSTGPFVRGGAEAAVELAHDLAEFLSRRYPTEYQVVRHDDSADRSAPEDSDAYGDWGWDDLPPIKSVTIPSVSGGGVSYDLPRSVRDGEKAGERAMKVAGLLVQDDLALMIEGSDGRYYFQAGSICVPGFWRMQDKIGMPLDEIHLTGNVPQYKERLHTSLERFFRRLPVEKPVIRNNYFVQTNRKETSTEDIDPEELGWAESSMGDEDEFEHGSHGTAKPKNVDAAVPAKVEWMRLRTERQTLRRLPRSGAVVFTIRTYITPIVELGREAGVPERMASALRSWPADVAGYKGKARGGWWEPMLEYLDKMAAGSVEL